ncbi:MAG: hypothetical protein ACE5FD_12765 [Anaerolineae bacterium]
MTPNTQPNTRAALIGVLISVAFNAGGQIFFKMARLGQPGAPIWALFGKPQIWVGLVLYGLSSVIWLWVLSRAQLSYAYPILALSFPLVVGLSAILFGEAISPLRWVGVALIVVGVSLLARS